MSNKFKEFLKKEGIARQTSTPYTPQQNGVAKRANRTIVEMEKSMLHAQNLSLNLWAEAVVNAVFTRNRCPTSAIPNMTPKQAWSGRQRRVDHMHMFGCIAFAKLPDSQRTKFEAKATKCLFLGYCESTKAYRVMSVNIKKILRSRDVTFFEDSTPHEASVDGPNGRNEGNEVIIDESTKTPIVVVDDEDEHDGDHDSATTLETKNGENERVPFHQGFWKGTLPQKTVFV